MYFVLSFSLILIFYEIYRLVFINKQMELVGMMEHMSKTQNEMEKRHLMNELINRKDFVMTFIVELSYIIFCLVLLFTKFWYVGLGMFGLVFIKSVTNNSKINRRTMWVLDCIVSTILLLVIPYMFFAQLM